MAAGVAAEHTKFQSQMRRDQNSEVGGGGGDITGGLRGHSMQINPGQQRGLLKLSLEDCAKLPLLEKEGIRYCTWQ